MVFRHPIAVALLTLIALPLAACGDGDPSPGDRADAGPDGPARFQRCVGASFTPEPAGAWRNLASNIVVAAGDASHSSQDVVAMSGTRTSVRGKFAYGFLDGLLSKDLEDEAIKAWVWDCTAWVALGVGITDSDGRVELDVTLGLGVGVYEVRFQVVGDATLTSSTLWILPAGTHLVVSDIDGTLTTSDGEIFREILSGAHVPVAYPGGTDLLDNHVDLGHIVVYLTGRPYALTQITRDWLADLAYPLGPLHVVDDVLDALPTDDAVAAFKQAYLDELRAAGFVIDLAYGNATTDITAYLGTGLAPDKVWIIGPNGGQQGTHAVVDSWAPRAAEVAALPSVEQPFTY